MAKSQKLFLAVTLLALLALGFAGYFYYQLRTLKQDPQAVNQEDVAELVAKVSALIVLPLNEIPTIATVADPEALKDQPFFLNAEKGDKVLIFTEAKKAVLYSVTLNKVLNIAPLNIGEKTAKSTEIPEVTPPTVKKK